MCCDSKTSCGATTTLSYEESKSITWDNSISIGEKLTLKEGFIFESVEMEFSVTGTFSNGGS